MVATSSPPTWLKHQAPSTSSPRNFSTVYDANALIVREALVWNTRPGAWDVEPPVSGSGPWSRTVTSVQPRSVSSSARFAPTIPAPMTTTRGVVLMASLFEGRVEVSGGRRNSCAASTSQSTT